MRREQGLSSLPSQHVPNLQLIAPFYFDRTLGLADEFIPDQSEGVAGDLDALTLSLRFHATRNVHGITPEVIDKFLAADDAGHHRTGIDTDAKRELPIAGFAFGYRRPHIEG